MRTLALFLFAGTLFGQRILYNQGLDKQGQDAAAAAKRIAGEPLAEKELQNLARIERQQIEQGLSAGFLTMRNQVQAFGTWQNVSRSVCKTLRMIYAKDEIAAELINAEVVKTTEFDQSCTVAALQAEKWTHDELTSELRARYTHGTMARLNDLSQEVKEKANHLKQTASKKPQSEGNNDEAGSTDSATQSLVNSAADRSADVRQLLELAGKLNPNTKTAGSVKALQQIEDGIKQLGALIETVDKVWDAYRGLSVDPRSLAPSRDKLAASLLAVEADRLKELIAIRASTEIYLDDLQTRLEDCTASLSSLHLWFSGDEVEDTLNQSTNSKNERINIILALHLATAGAVANQTPLSIQLLRESIAERRYALRRDSIYNGAYEQALQAAGERLSNYYGSGLKPSQLAALLYYLSGMVSLPAIAF